MRFCVDCKFYVPPAVRELDIKRYSTCSNAGAHKERNLISGEIEMFHGGFCEGLRKDIVHCGREGVWFEPRPSVETEIEETELVEASRQETREIIGHVSWSRGEGQGEKK